MTIEIQRPELEALVQERMKSGAVEDVNDGPIQALNSSLPPEDIVSGPPDAKSRATSAELISAMQASPSNEIRLEPGREPMLVRDIVF